MQKHEIKIKLETVTPLFLGGAEPRGEPELRPPAFRGAMRYWLRVALGGVLGDKNLAGLHTLEEAVFGSTHQGSPISIQLNGDLSNHIQTKKILPHKPESPGRRPAFYKDTNAKIKPFEAIIRQRSSGKIELDDLILQNACMSLNLMVLFGGVGLRSRRGNGTLRVKESNTDLIPVSPNTVLEWQKHIEKICLSSIEAAKVLAEEFGERVTGLPNSPTDFPSASQQGIIWLEDSSGEDSAEEALVSLMRRMPQDRSFGGIVPHTDERNSSPLWARVIWADNKYRLLFCVLPSWLRWRGSTDYQKIKNFLQTKFPGHPIQVQGWNL